MTYNIFFNIVKVRNNCKLCESELSCYLNPVLFDKQFSRLLFNNLVPFASSFYKKSSKNNDNSNNSSNNNNNNKII